jgi:hypothetical protein
MPNDQAILKELRQINQALVDTKWIGKRLERAAILDHPVGTIATGVLCGVIVTWIFFAIIGFVVYAGLGAAILRWYRGF